MKTVDCSRWYNSFLVGMLPGYFACKIIPTPDPTPGPGPTPDPGEPVPIKLAHGDKTSAPKQDQTKENGARRKDLPGISEVRLIETKSDKFLIVPKDKIHSRVNADGTVTAWVDDFVGASGTVYCGDSWTFLKDGSEKVHDNPVTVPASKMKPTTRARWQAYNK